MNQTYRNWNFRWRRCSTVTTVSICTYPLFVKQEIASRTYFSVRFGFLNMKKIISFLQRRSRSENFNPESLIPITFRSRSVGTRYIHLRYSKTKTEMDWIKWIWEENLICEFIILLPFSSLPLPSTELLFNIWIHKL